MSLNATNKPVADLPKGEAVNAHKQMAQGKMPKVPACPYPGKAGSKHYK